MIAEKIANDYKNALKAHDEFTVGMLRMLRAALQNVEIAARPRALTDDDATKVIKTEVKKLEDALVDFLRGGRKDLTEKTEREIKFLRAYLPEELSEGTVEEIVRRVIDVMKPSGPKDFGRVMGAAMKEAGGRASGDAVSKIVKRLLA